MGSYVMISDAPDRAIKAWLKDFEELRVAGQKLTGVKDSQLLPLTVLLFNRRSEFEKVLPRGSRRNAALAVGFDQQPVIAFAANSDPVAKDFNIRFVVVSWLLGSSGLAYDQWIKSGFYDLFSMARTSSHEIEVGKPNWAKLGQASDYLKEHRHSSFDLGAVGRPRGLDWLALHYLLINHGRWMGLSGLADYQRRVTLGESRNQAFTQVFGISPSQLISALKDYCHHAKIHPASVPWQKPERLDKIKITPASPGLRELSLARFMLQVNGANYSEAGRLIDEAAIERGWDVGVQEGRFLQGLMTRQSGLAAESLNMAITLGTHNPTLQLLWCMGALKHAMQRNNGFILDEDQAVKVADTLHDLVSTNGNRMMGYMLLAQVVPSIRSARPQDREMLEAGVKTSPISNPLLLTGLAAWDWRHGDRTKANAELESVLQESSLNSGAATFAKWLRAQLDADQLAGKIKASMAAGDYNEARRLLNGFSPRYALMPELKGEINQLYRVAGEEEVITEAEQAMAAGQADKAGLLVRSLAVSDLPPALQDRAQKVLAHPKPKAPDSAGAAK